MCGFLVEFNEVVNLKRFEGAFDKIKYRGPDYSGIKVFENEIWGHHRLSIINLSDGANQPVVENHSKLVFNGEILNYIELGNQFFNKNYESDTIFLFDYLESGYRDFQYFKGFWSFIYKNENERIICRDKLGIKPLYYFKSEGIEVFSSEVKALLPYCSKIDFNYRLFNTYLDNGGADGFESTMLKNIYQVPAGTYFANNKHYRYYKLGGNKESYSFVDWSDLLKSSVKLSSRSDVAISISLSSGIDSNITNLFTSPKPTAFTAGKTTRGIIDEFQTVKLVCSELSQNLHTLTVDENITFDEIAESLNVVDFPSWNLNPAFYLKYYRKISKEGFKVLLEGHGVDEYLGGYQKHIYDFMYDAFIRFKFKSSYKIYKTLLEASNQGYYGLGRPYWQYVVKIVLNFFGLDFRSKNEKRVRKILNKRNIFSIKLVKPFIIKRSRFFRHLDISKNIIPTVLRVFDRVTMANGIEMRPPLLDSSLVEKGLSQNFKELIGDLGQKYPFRKILKDSLYPSYILNQKKKYGFSADLHFLVISAAKCIELVDQDFGKRHGINMTVVESMFEEYKETNEWQLGEVLSRIFSLIIWINSLEKHE